MSFKPSLSRSERDTFCLIVKDTVDPIRATLRRLTATITAAPTSEHKAALEGIRAKSLSRLDAVCGDAVALINGTLLPNASETAALVFFQKMLGDLHRYSCEFADRPDVKDLALQAYTEGLRAAEGVADADPVKLGLVLNFAVFCREHLGDESRAVDLVTDALQRVEDRVDALSEESTKASLAVI